MSEQERIPDFTLDDFLKTSDPYEWLYQFKDNKFKLTQLVEQMKILANEKGFKRFISTWNEFVKQEAAKAKIALENVTEFEDQDEELFTGKWTCNDYGVFSFDKNGFEITACPHPILPVRRLINIDTGTEKMEIKFRRKGKPWKKIIVDKTTISSANKIVSLSEYGVSVTSENAKHLVKFLCDIEIENDDKIPEINSVERLGWIEDYGFSPYVDNLVFDGALNFKHFFESVNQKGSLEKWIEVAKEARKNTIARIMLASSFASVLVKPCNALTFFVHLWGGTESGKTVGLMLSASVWADPTMGAYIHTFNSTTVGQELSATFVNSMPLIIDELQIVSDRKDFDKMIYTLAEGVGKGRGNVNGGLRKVGSWQNCILTTGEQPVTNASSAGGAVNRIIEIDCKDQKIFENPVDIVARVKKNYGIAGKKFIEKLQEEGSIEYAQKLQKEFYQELSNGETTEKQIMAASVILTADRLINEWFFDDGQTLSISDISPYLVSKKDISANERAYDFICDYISINNNKFRLNEYGDYDNECWGCVDGNSQDIDEHVYIIKSQFDKIMRNEGYNPVAFLSWAKQNGLVRTSSRHNSISKRINGIVTRCVALKLKPEEREVPDFDDSDLPFA